MVLVIEQYVNYAIATIASLLSLASLLHCALQRSDAFPALGSLTKGAWLAILAGCMLLTLLTFGGSSTDGSLGLFGLIGLIASLVYLLDVRPGLNEQKSGY